MDPAARRVPLEKRKRTETSCDKCKSRKQKCDKMQGQLQCRYCQLRGFECSITQPRKKRVYSTLEGDDNRLALLESLVKGLLPEADLSSSDEMRLLGKSLGIPLPATQDVFRSTESQKNERESDEGQESVLPLMPDQQGQVQYIGPASSFSFHLNLRRLMGSYSSLEFSMFGKNAAEDQNAAKVQDAGNGAEAIPACVPDARRLNTITNDCNSPSDAVREIDGPVLDSLIDTYFEVVHTDFPVLHEASFREAYEIWCASDATSATNPVWLCGLLCVLILARRVAAFAITDEAEHKWWRHVQTLLPTVFFASNVFTVQALMLGALHLHNTSHRDACWNLTGTAIRIAYAIGLHRDDVKHVQSPLGRELRKQLWWTLYAFEQMQVSSYDRPSSIEHTLDLVGCPNERIIGANNCPQDYMKWSQSLVVLLGAGCKALKQAGPGISTTEEAYTKPLSPPAIILRDLKRWKEELPSHLRIQSIDSLSPSSQRPLILLHAQFHYTIILMSRSSLLRRATLIAGSYTGPLSSSLQAVSDTCIESGRSLGRLLRKLDTIKKFNVFTWWDTFYTVSSSLVLTLDISCSVRQQNAASAAESQLLLGELASLMQKRLHHPRIPGSTRKWAGVVLDVNLMAQQMVLGSHHIESAQYIDATLQDSIFSTIPNITQQHDVQIEVSTATSTQITKRDAFSYADPHHPRSNAHQFWSQTSFMDDPNYQENDWNWEDIDTMLKGGLSTEHPGSDRRLI